MKKQNCISTCRNIDNNIRLQVLLEVNPFCFLRYILTDYYNAQK